MIWRSGSSSSTQAVTTVSGTTWRIVSVGDFDGDGFADLLWRNGSTGQNIIWKRGNSNTRQAVSPMASPAWTIVPYEYQP
jgi:hypothetical protein